MVFVLAVDGLVLLLIDGLVAAVVMVFGLVVVTVVVMVFGLVVVTVVMMVVVMVVLVLRMCQLSNKLVRVYNNDVL